MCWSTYVPSPRQIAECDITCYKIMIQLESGQFMSLFQHTLYTENMTSVHLEPKAFFIPQYDMCLIEIDRGYHSYERIELAKFSFKSNWISESDPLVIVECYIPEGSEYYVNLFGEIVSSNIKINKVVWKD